MSKHLCPVHGCTVSVPNARLMCFSHWARVPLDLKDAVNVAYRTQGVGSPELQAAQAEAIAAVNKTIKEKTVDAN